MHCSTHCSVVGQKKEGKKKRKNESIGQNVGGSDESERKERNTRERRRKTREEKKSVEGGVETVGSAYRDRRERRDRTLRNGTRIRRLKMKRVRGGCEGQPREEKAKRDGLGREADRRESRRYNPRGALAPFLRITRTGSSWLVYYTIAETRRAPLFWRVRMTRTETVHIETVYQYMCVARTLERYRERKRKRARERESLAESWEGGVERRKED